MLRLDPDEKLNEQDSIVLNSTLTLPKTIIEVHTKSFVDKKYNDLSITKNTAHADFNDNNLDNVRFVKVNSMPAVREHLTPKHYVDLVFFNNVYESTLLRLNPDEKLKLDEQDFIVLNSVLTSPKTIIELPTKSYVDSLLEINKNRRDSWSVYNDQDNDFDIIKLTNLDSITVNRDPSCDNELANKIYVDDSIVQGNVLSLYQTLQNYLKVSVGYDTYDLTKYDRIQSTDTTIVKYPNTGGYLLQDWVINCNDKNNHGKKQDFIKSTKTNSPTGSSAAESLPPIGKSFMYIQTSSNNQGKNVFVSFERTTNIQNSNITLYFNRFSILTNDSLKSMGRLSIQFVLEDNTWSTKYNIPKNDRYSDSSTEWTELILYYSEENYGIKFSFDEIDSAYSDICFSNFSITHSVY